MRTGRKFIELIEFVEFIELNLNRSGYFRCRTADSLSACSFCGNQRAL